MTGFETSDGARRRLWSWWILGAVWLWKAIRLADAGVPDLPFGDINAIVVTDVHSFVGGHPHEADRDADYGDVLSFYRRVKEHCETTGRDLWFFMNGDWIHGTGLAMDGNASALVPLLERMPWDGINLGNHEVYHSAVVELMRDEMIPHFGEAFLASNTYLKELPPDGDTDHPTGFHPFGQTYRLLRGQNSTLLVFGFLYDLHNPSHLLEVAKVEDVLAEPWFRQVLREKEYDAICVLAHMDNDDPLIEKILSRIREHTDYEMPVQFLTGHTHERKGRKIGKNVWARAMEAGGLLDTVGFVSFPTAATAKSVHKGEAAHLFHFEWLNSSKAVLRERSGADVLRTEEGEELSRLIHETRGAMGLNETVGCLPRDYYLNRGLHDEESVYRLWRDHVVPSQIFKNQRDGAMIISSKSFRYDIRGVGRQERITVDDVVAVVPYMEPVVYVGEVPAWVLLRMNSSLNTYSLNEGREVPDYLLAGHFDYEDDKSKLYKFYTHNYNLPEIMDDLDRLHEHDLQPTRTNIRDTLYWLDYAETAWQCRDDNDPKKVVPWFSHANELEEEDTDGARTSEDEDTELEKELASEELAEELAEEAAGGGEEDHPESEFHYSGFDGYVPPSVIAEFGDKLPEGMTHEVLKPKEHKASAATAAPKKHTAAWTKAHDPEALAALRARRKKTRRTVFKVIGILLGCVLLLVPVVGLFRVFFPEKESLDMNDETFYDMDEMRALKKQKKPKPAPKRGRWKRGRKPKPKPKPLPLEISMA